MLRLAEGVTRSRIMGRNGLAEITRLSITPTAKRNSYRVAILVETLPRVAGHARNPGLCNRNSYRVAAADGWPLPGPPKGLESLLAVFKDVWWRSFPLEKAGMGLLCWPQKYPSPVSLFVETGEGLVAVLSPLGESWRGALGLLLSLRLCHHLHPRTRLNYRIHYPLPS